VKVGNDKKQKQILVTNLHETYALFKEEIPTVKLGLTTFQSLRPLFVKSVMQWRLA
jgi:hypothetical protein